MYLSNLEEFLLARYVLNDERVARQPNPAGMLAGEHADAYRALLARLSELPRAARRLRSGQVQLLR